jgi:integrase
LLSNVEDADLTYFIAWAWWTGMRKGEAAILTWKAFDHETWTVTLQAKDAKAHKARTLAIEGPLREIIERRIRARRLDCPLILHRGGHSVREFRKA